MLTQELLRFLFDGRSHPLGRRVATWLAASRRFSTFVGENQTKIRKKLRTADEPETLRGLELELETAYLLLRERSLSVVYEPQHEAHPRCPDFAVSFTTSYLFMVEVTRMRASLPSGLSGGRESATERESATAREPAVAPGIKSARPGPPLGDRFSDTLCSKLGQLLPQRGNVLIVGLDGPVPAQTDLQAAMRGIQLRAEGNDPALVQRHGFRDRGEFFRGYQRMSALLARGTPLKSGEPAVIWENPQAKHPLPGKVRTALQRSHTP